MQVKRYDLIRFGFENDSEMIEQDGGEWVRYEDVIRALYDATNANIAQHLTAIVETKKND